MDLWKVVMLLSIASIRGTIDVNLSELEYLAARLDLVECRRLVAALHYRSYDFPESEQSLDDAERNIDKDIPCLRLLLHWNNSPAEGLGESHELLERRLRQLGHRELADWLGRTTFRELGKDLLRAIDEPLLDVTTTSETTIPLAASASSGTREQIDDDEDDYRSGDDDDDDFWRIGEMLMIGLFCLLLFTLILLGGALVIDKYAWCDSDDDNEEVSADNRKLLSIN